MRTERISGTCRVYHGDETIGKAVYDIELCRETDTTGRPGADPRASGYERYDVSLTDHELNLEALRGKTLTLHLQDGRQLKIIVGRTGLTATGRLQ